eukprot:TRINITY_DN2446_c0_g2_i1.p1 TRINITY_DN2446_c0_g2~~TRINITY_DN2446_c0_g2_i1.p1  ORF type:complete len:615 (-),score=143.68 TRINITY_DN2446_c0_g2_i1:68-1912(-)
MRSSQRNRQHNTQNQKKQREMMMININNNNRNPQQQCKNNIDFTRFISLLLFAYLIVVTECRVVPATSLIGDIKPIPLNVEHNKPTQSQNTESQNESTPTTTTTATSEQHHHQQQIFPAELNPVRKYVLRRIKSKLPFCGFEYPKTNTKKEENQNEQQGQSTGVNNSIDVTLVYASKQDLHYSDGTNTMKKPESRVNAHGRQEVYQNPIVFGTNYFLTFDLHNNTDDITTRYNITVFQDLEKLYSVTKCTHIILTENNKEEGSEGSDETSESTENVENSKENDEKSIDNNNASTDKLNILSYNIWNYNDPWNTRKDILVNVSLSIPDTIPHIILWQEVRYSEHKHINVLEEVRDKWGGGRSQAEALLKGFHNHGIDYQYVYQPAMTYLKEYPTYEMEGLAIFSLYPIVQTSHRTLSRDIHDATDEHQRICLSARIKTNLGLVDVFVTHMSLSNSAQLRNIVEIWEFMKSFDSDEKIPQFLMGDMNNKPDSLPVKFLLGEHEISGKRGDLKDLWSIYSKNKGLVCDEFGVCTNTPLQESDGYTFSTLNEKLTSRIDFVFARNVDVEKDEVLRFRDMLLIGDKALEIDKDNDGEVDKEIFASDHLGLLTQFISPKR